MLTVSRARVFTFTGTAALLYVALTIVFADGLWDLGNFWSSEAIFEGAWFTYTLLAAIIVLGVIQGQQLGKDEFTVAPNSDAEVNGQVEDPNFWKLLIGNTWLAALWLPIRFFVGHEWLTSGEGKVRSGAWMDGGEALKGYFERAVAIPEAPARPAITFGWYREFLQYMLDNEWYIWFAKIVAVGEVLVGLGLIVGALVGIAAFFGALMNFNFLLAGTASTNPVLFSLGVLLIVGWKVAGHLGLDRWLLPALGTPWRHRPEATRQNGRRPVIGEQRHNPA